MREARTLTREGAHRSARPRSKGTGLARYRDANQHETGARHKRHPFLLRSHNGAVREVLVDVERSAERQRELECGCSTWSQLQDTSWRCCVAWCSTMRSERCAACAKEGKRSGRISEREHVQRSGCRSERRIEARGAAGIERTTSALGAPGAAGWTSPRAAARGARGRGARRPPAADARRSVGRSAFMVLAAARASRLSCGARDSCWDAWGRQRAPACSDMSRSSRLSSLV